MDYPQAVGSERKMDRNIQRELGSRLLKVALLPAFASVSLYGTAALAQPVKKIAAVPANAVARASQSNSSTLTLEGAKDLLEQSTNSAADLKTRPSLWDWTKPVTTPQLSQIPSDVPQPTVAAAPAPEDTSDFLDEVSVTATRRLARQRDTTATTYTIKKEDFQKQGAATVTDALLLVPGFQAQPALGGTRNAGSVFLRGFDDQRFQVLKDGLSLQRSSNNRNDVSRFQIEDLERIEVVTGGATLRYGSGAVGGVINLITETPSGPPKLTLKYEVGSYGFSKYVAKYGGGDDTFSYNLVYTGLVAFNDYPFKYTLPGSAQFYGPTNNPSSTSPSGGANSVGQGAPDPTNNGTTDLFGFLKPDVGPPLTVQGRADSAFNGSDTYSAKLVFKPAPGNKISLRLNQQNSKTAQEGPGSYSTNACLTGASLAANPTLARERGIPLNSDGTENAANCSKLFIPNTRTAYLVNNNLGGVPIYPFTRSSNGTPIAPGQVYPNDPVTGTTLGFQQSNQSQSEFALQWDYDITPTTSLNSYAYFYTFKGNATREPRFFTGTDISSRVNDIAIGIANNPGDPDAAVNAASFRSSLLGNNGFLLQNPAQPYFEGQKLELQTSLDTAISSSSRVQFGLNFVDDRSYQLRSNGTFFDKSISRSALFLVADLGFSEQLRAQIGGRYTYSTQFGVVATPAVGIRYSPTNILSFRANYSYVFNAPSISDLNVSGGPFIPNPNLRPESGVTYDVGLDFTPTQDIILQLTYFNTYLDGAIGAAAFVQAGSLVFQQQNLDSRYASGIELTGKWKINNQFQFQISWTNNDSRQYGRTDSISNPNGQLYFYGFQDPNIPNNNVVATLTYANKGWTATLLGRFNSEKRRFASLETVPSFATLDLNVEIPISPSLTLTGNVFNLTDTQYEVVDGLPGVGTTFRVGGRLEFGG
jgi:iron complex outermembrane recepter protein